MSSSDSDSDSSEELSTSFKNLRGAFRKLDQEIAESIDALHRIQKAVKHTEKHTALPDLTSEYPLLHKYLSVWKKENRINNNGSKVFLNKKEVRSLFNTTHSSSGLQPEGTQKFGLEEGWVSIYKICEYLKK